jgi:hypothetical protein
VRKISKTVKITVTLLHVAVAAFVLYRELNKASDEIMKGWEW